MTFRVRIWAEQLRSIMSEFLHVTLSGSLCGTVDISI